MIAVMRASRHRNAAAFVTALGCAVLVFASTAAGLPQGRVYEMVSPLYKAGAPVEQPGRADYDVASGGEAVVFASLGAFAGVESDAGGLQYLARRGAGGWTTSAAGIIPSVEGKVNEGEMYSSNLTESMSRASFAPNYYSSEEATTQAFYLHDLLEPQSPFVLASPLLKTLSGGHFGVGLMAASEGFAHVILDDAPDYPQDHLVPEDTMEDGAYALYELSGTSGSTPMLRLVGVNNQHKVIDPDCDVSLGGVGSAFHALSREGSEIFFSTNINPSAQLECDVSSGRSPSNPDELFVRINGSRTLEVSKPEGKLECGEPKPGETEACTGANRATVRFQGASESGSRAFFTTTGRLVGEDTDSSNDLYMAVIEHEALERLVMVSHDANAGEAAEVQGVLRIGDDGSHIYYVAHGLLAGANTEGVSPAKGADNLYAYDTTSGHTAFVADLCSGPDESGETLDAHCGANLNPQQGKQGGLRPVNDSELWLTNGGEGEAQVNGCEAREAGCEAGRFLVFSTYAQLTPDDTDTARDVYEYDFQTGRLARVSIGEDGHDDNGNNDAFDASITPVEFNLAEVERQQEMNTRAVSDNGSTIVFTTSESLSPQAVDGVSNVYEWHDGKVGLISSGLSPEPGEDPVIDPSGRDIFFRTAAGLVPQDTDGLRDIYDARIGGGFPEPPAPQAPCSADSCQGPLSVPPQVPTLGSLSQAANGNLAPPSPSAAATKSKRKAGAGRKTKKKSKRKKRKATARGTKVGRANRSGGGRRR